MAPIDSPPLTPHSFSQPRPRPPRSPGHLAQIRVQNRRRAYLEKHPSYFESTEHELADPLLYDFLIRRFQTPAEREAEGRAKGYARVLEGSLLRGEERLAKLRAQTVGRNGVVNGDGGRDGDGHGNEGGQRFGTGVTGPASSVVGEGSGLDPVNGGYGDGVSGSNTATGAASEMDLDNEKDQEATGPGTAFSSLNAELTAPPKTKTEGRAQWEEFLRDRFIRGEDEDFDYAAVDGDDEYDVQERVDREEAWFEAEDPGWATSGDEDEDSERKGGREKMLMGETGVQDF